MLPRIPMQGPRLTCPGAPALHMGHIRRTAWQGIPFPCLPAVPMRSGAPCATSHPPRPALGSPKPAHPISLHRFPATRGGGGSGNALRHLHGYVSTGLTSRPLTATPLPPRPAAGPLKYAPTQLTQIPWGAWVRHRFAMRRRRLRRSRGLHSSPPGGGQLRGGIYVSFPGQTVFSHQVCAGGSVSFCRRLSKAGLSGFV